MKGIKIPEKSKQMESVKNSRIKASQIGQRVTSTTRNPERCEVNIRRAERWEEGAGRQGRQDSRRSPGVSALAFIFASMYPDLELKKSAMWKHQQVPGKRAPTKTCFLEAK